jgi:hypothetical protein
MDDLGRADQAEHRITIRGVGDIAGEHLHSWRQVDRSALAMHLRVQDVHDRDVIAGADEPARECGPDESCPAADKYGI